MISVKNKTDEVYDKICANCGNAIGWLDTHTLKSSVVVERYIDRLGAATCDHLTSFPVTADMFHTPDTE